MHASSLPLATNLGCVCARHRDYWRLGWWSMKALRRDPKSAFLLLVIMILTIPTVGLFDGWNDFSIATHLAAVFFIVLVLVFLGTVRVWVQVDRIAGLYLSPSRNAVIVIVVDRANGWWEMKSHVVRAIGRGYGAELRAIMQNPLQNAALAAGVRLYGKAANKKVQQIYLQSGWGFRPHEKDGVIWP